MTLLPGIDLRRRILNGWQMLAAKRRSGSGTRAFFLPMARPSPKVAGRQHPRLWSAVSKKARNDKDGSAAATTAEGIEPEGAPADGSGRRYEKGVGRKKHVGTRPEPYIEHQTGRPRHYVGKCPNNVSIEEATELLQRAIPGDNGDREADYPKVLYMVREGAIYEAATSNAGVSYHAYPYRGKLAKALVEELRSRFVNESSRKAFEQWIKEQITYHGSWTA